MSDLFVIGDAVKVADTIAARVRAAGITDPELVGQLTRELYAVASVARTVEATELLLRAHDTLADVGGDYRQKVRAGFSLALNAGERSHWPMRDVTRAAGFSMARVDPMNWDDARYCVGQLANRYDARRNGEGLHMGLGDFDYVDEPSWWTASGPSRDDPAVAPLIDDAHELDSALDHGGDDDVADNCDCDLCTARRDEDEDEDDGDDD